jgi:hypothetical protein
MRRQIGFTKFPSLGHSSSVAAADVASSNQYGLSLSSNASSHSVLVAAAEILDDDDAATGGGGGRQKAPPTLRSLKHIFAIEEEERKVNKYSIYKTIRAKRPFDHLETEYIRSQLSRGELVELVLDLSEQLSMQS